MEIFLWFLAIIVLTALVFIVDERLVPKCPYDDWVLYRTHRDTLRCGKCGFTVKRSK